jgi:structural maintenance of chromosome 1
MLAVDTQIAHSERKIKNAEKISEDVKRDITKEQQKLTRLQADLKDVNKASDAAASAYPSHTPTDCAHTGD